MRAAALAVAVSLFASPSFARGRKASTKGPQEGRFCAKTAVGTTAQDSSGSTLTCKADKKGKPRWTK